MCILIHYLNIFFSNWNLIFNGICAAHKLKHLDEHNAISFYLDFYLKSSEYYEEVLEDQGGCLLLENQHQNSEAPVQSQDRGQDQQIPDALSGM